MACAGEVLSCARSPWVRRLCYQASSQLRAATRLRAVTAQQRSGSAVAWTGTSARPCQSSEGAVACTDEAWTAFLLWHHVCKAHPCGLQQLRLGLVEGGDDHDSVASGCEGRWQGAAHIAQATRLREGRSLHEGCVNTVCAEWTPLLALTALTSEVTKTMLNCGAHTHTGVSARPSTACTCQHVAAPASSLCLGWQPQCSGLSVRTLRR